LFVWKPDRRDAYMQKQEASLMIVAADNVELSEGQSGADARARAILESVAKRRILITYQELANALQILPPHSIHRVTQALERLMEEDTAADRPFIAAVAISKARGGLPGAGFFDCAPDVSAGSRAIRTVRTLGCFTPLS
jgi:hypothetical protein